MALPKFQIKKASVNPAAFVEPYGYKKMPYELRLDDLRMAMQDIYDYFADINGYLLDKGLKRLEDMVRPQTLSGLISDMLSASLAKHSRVLRENEYHNGHPDLIPDGRYPGNAIAAGEDGVEVKSTTRRGGGVDFHGGRRQWLCVYVYEVDNETEPKRDRRPMIFREVYLAPVEEGDFRWNKRGQLGTPTASLHREGLKKLRTGCVYLDRDPKPSKRGIALQAKSK